MANTEYLNYIRFHLGDETTPLPTIQTAETPTQPRGRTWDEWTQTWDETTETWDQL